MHMYTRCPNCSTIFRVTAAQLRVALGEDGIVEEPLPVRFLGA